MLHNTRDVISLKEVIWLRVFSWSKETEGLLLHQTCESAGQGSTGSPISFSISNLVPYLTQAPMLHVSTWEHRPATSCPAELPGLLAAKAAIAWAELADCGWHGLRGTHVCQGQPLWGAATLPGPDPSLLLGVNTNIPPSRRVSLFIGGYFSASWVPGFSSFAEAKQLEKCLQRCHKNLGEVTIECACTLWK